MDKYVDKMCVIVCVEEEVLAAISVSKYVEKYKIPPSFFTHLSWRNGYRAD